MREGGKPPPITGGVIIIIDDDEDNDAAREAEVRRQTGANRRQVPKVKYNRQAGRSGPSRRSRRVKKVEKIDGESVSALNLTILLYTDVSVHRGH